MITTDKEMLNQLEKEKKRISQEKAQLVNTKACIQMIREARQKNLQLDIINELYKCIQLSAIDEWGDGTLIDDFNDPPHFVVINGKKREKI